MLDINFQIIWPFAPKCYIGVPKQLKAAIREEIKTQNLRRSHQDQLIKKYKTTGNTKMAKKIRGMKRAEET